ncbi:hypothetical protein SESBI_03640 [Sesbania bispinosa]|nr:hypothetical protein SESBI_03640 [Sesbania bispinosa]
MQDVGVDLALSNEPSLGGEHCSPTLCNLREASMSSLEKSDFNSNSSCPVHTVRNHEALGSVQLAEEKLCEVSYYAGGGC